MIFKYCTRCDEEKELKLFSKRGISKKTGVTIRNSWCKRCVLDDSKIRRDEKAIKRSPQKALYMNSKIKHKGTIKPEFLVRGNISIGSNDSSISNQA